MNLAGTLSRAAVILLAAAAHASAQTAPLPPMSPSAPHEKLAMFIGTWTMDVFPPEAQMRETCDWLGSGRRHMVCHSRWETARGRREGLSIFSYRESDQAYIYQGFRAGGGTQTLTGKPRAEGGWEFTGDEGRGSSRLQTLVRISPRLADGTFRFTERTARGDGPWSDDEVVIYRAAAVAQDSLLSQVQGLGLASSTNLITVYYPAEHEAKALRLRALVEEAMGFYERSLGVRGELHLAVLPKADWEKVITGQPYGIPGVDGTPPVAFLPATDDGLAATDALSIRPGVSPETVRLIETAGGSYEDASRRYVDLVGLHELGHTYTSRFGIRVPSRWAGELLATSFAYAFLREHAPAQAEVWDGILRAYRDAVTPTYTTLADFDRLYFGVGAQNYIWYQARFQQMVRAAYEAQGLDFLRAVRTAFPAGEGPVSPEETLRRFEAIFPAFGEWAKTMR